MIRRLDRNNDGLINFMEFVEYFMIYKNILIYFCIHLEDQNLMFIAIDNKNFKDINSYNRKMMFWQKKTLQKSNQFN